MERQTCSDWIMLVLIINLIIISFWYRKHTFCFCPQELDKIVEYELKMGGVLLHPTFSGGKEKDK